MRILRALVLVPLIGRTPIIIREISHITPQLFILNICGMLWRTRRYFHKQLLKCSKINKEIFLISKKVSPDKKQE